MPITTETKTFATPIKPVLWKHYTVFDGLAGMRVEAIHQDQRGFLWIATADGGLSRFDGVNFDNLTTADGLPHDTVMTIAETADGTLYFGTYGGGLAAYADRRFTIYTIDDGLPCNEILNLRVEDGTLLICTRTGIARLRHGKIVDQITEIEGHPVKSAYDAIDDAMGRTWLASRSGLISLDGETLECPMPSGQGPLNGPWNFALDAQDNIWISHSYPGTLPLVHRYNSHSGQISLIRPAASTDTGAVRSGVRHIRIDDDQRVWIVHHGVLSLGEQGWQRVLIDIPEMDFSDTRLTYEDREGNIWIGLWGGGLLFCNPFEIEKQTQADGLPDTEITDLRQNRDGQIWIGTMGGLAKLEEKEICEIPFAPPGATCDIDRLCLDGNDALWFLSRGKLYKETEGHFQQALELANDDCVISSWADPDGYIWLGTDHGDLGPITEEGFAGIPTGLNDNIYILQRDKYGRCWIGSFGSFSGSGLHYFDGKKSQLPHQESMQRISYVQCMLLLGDTLWVGTGTGLYAYDIETDAVRHFTVAEGLPENSILALTQDDAGHLWIGTTGGGAVRYDGHTFQAIRLGNSALDNIVVAILPSTDGDLLFGTKGGLIRYRPGSIAPNIAIRQVAAGQVFSEPEQVRCQAPIPELRIAFQGIGFRAGASQLRYSHRLIGQSESWSAFAAATEMTFSDLPPGSYRFEVRAMDCDGLYSAPATLDIKIDPDPRQDRIIALEEALTQPLGLNQFTGQSAALEKVLEQIATVAETDVTVLILGETGTGKGMAARAIHQTSPRREAPFIQVNCGALPDGLVESELFGHEKGAFTGATGRKVGRFELAQSGTLFLDEIGDMPLETQTVLLQVLQERTLLRVGGSETIAVDVRVIAATNRDLQQAMREGRFREDLYYRLSVFTVDLPPLRQRRGDIPLLASFFAERFALHLQRPTPSISPTALDWLCSYNWPGNVRELEHLIQRAVLVCRENSIALADLAINQPPPPSAIAIEHPGLSHAEFAAQAQERERLFLTSILDSSNWVIYGDRGAAARLGIHPEKLRARMKKLKLVRVK